MDDDLPGDLLGLDIGCGAGGDLVLVDQALVQPGTLAGGEHIRGQIEQHGFARAPLGHVPDLHDTCLRHAVFDLLSVLAGAAGDPRLLPGDWRSAGDAAEVPLDQFARLFRRDVTGDRDHCIGRAIVGAKPLVDIL